MGAMRDLHRTWARLPDWGVSLGAKSFLWTFEYLSLNKDGLMDPFVASVILLSSELEYLIFSVVVGFFLIGLDSIDLLLLGFSSQDIVIRLLEGRRLLLRAEYLALKGICVRGERSFIALAARSAYVFNEKGVDGLTGSISVTRSPSTITPSSMKRGGGVRLVIETTGEDELCLSLWSNSGVKLIGWSCFFLMGVKLLDFICIGVWTRFILGSKGWQLLLLCEKSLILLISGD
mmetsp:Transcript_1519/g.2276  ORF Transcript_1519/g.2276 Transcript_1519/m.2276 type:complete len:233 (+) Transcript_1519:524-1222(+)